MLNHQLNCNDKCLIHLLSCKLCGLQYTSSTDDKFGHRWNNYKEDNRKAKRGEEYKQPLVFEYEYVYVYMCICIYVYLYMYAYMYVCVCERILQWSHCNPLYPVSMYFCILVCLFTWWYVPFYVIFLLFIVANQFQE